MPQTLEEAMKEKGLYEVTVQFQGMDPVKITRPKPVELVKGGHAIKQPETKE